MTTTPPVPPAVPSTTPAWLARAVAFLVAIAGPLLAWIDPTGKIDTPTAQAIVILGFLIVAALIFIIDTAIKDLKHYGLTKIGLLHVVSDEEAEIKVMWPEIKTEWATAKPGLESINGASTAITAVTTDVAAVKEKLAEIPDQAAVEQIVEGWLGSKGLLPPPGMAPAYVPAITNATVSPDPTQGVTA